MSKEEGFVLICERRTEPVDALLGPGTGLLLLL